MRKVAGAASQGTSGLGPGVRRPPVEPGAGRQSYIGTKRTERAAPSLCLQKPRLFGSQLVSVTAEL